MKTLLPLALVSVALVGCDAHDPPPEPFGVPISGGTMIVSHDGARAIVADPDRDRILTIALATGDVVGELALEPGDEPGRLVEDAAGRVHVALRRGGAVVTIDAAGALLDRRPACAEPRGIAFDAAADTIHVACTGGELVTFATAGGPAVRTMHLDRDLRDVVVQGDRLVVTRFHSAELITIDAGGNILSRQTPPVVQRVDGGGFDGLPPNTGDELPPSKTIDAAASTAWRTIALPDGRLVMSHQRKVKSMLDSDLPGGYGGDCGGGPVEDAVTVVPPGGAPQAVARIGHAALPVDLAVSPAGDKLALLTAGNRTVTVVPAVALGAPDEDTCEPPPPCPIDPDFPIDDTPVPAAGAEGAPAPGQCCPDQDGDGRCDDDEDDRDRLGPPTSVAFTPAGDLVIFYPEAPALIVRPGAGDTTRRIDLPGARANDPGRNVFHAQTRIGLACASCHPEGREDGLVWTFASLGPRRTQSIAGHVMARAPFHWGGDMKNFSMLLDDVFTKRMSGGSVTARQKAALGPWLDRIPAPAPRVVDPAAAARGQAIFEDPAVGCTGCHGGPLLTNSLLVDVGTGGTFKVPSLIGVGARPPYMHDGCAETLLDRFTTCGNSSLHGHTSQLTADQLTDLVTYLESL